MLMPQSAAAGSQFIQTVIAKVLITKAFSLRFFLHNGKKREILTHGDETQQSKVSTLQLSTQFYVALPPCYLTNACFVLKQ